MGAVTLWGVVELGPIQHNVAWDEAYLYTKFAS